MYEYDIDLDPSLLKHESTNGIFLTKAKLCSEKNKIEVTYHEYKNGEILKSTSFSYGDSYHNYHKVLEQRYESLVRIIEIKDPNLFQRIDNLREKRDKEQLKYEFYRTISFLSAAGAISCGYSLANMDSDSLILKLILAGSITVLLFGIYTRKQFLLNKRIFEVDCERILDQIETSTREYTRSKKKGENE